MRTTQRADPPRPGVAVVAKSSLRKELGDLLGSLRGWRLEPRTTPGASPLWCFVSSGKIEYSVSVEGSVILLYEMETDGELHFADREALVTWLQQHRPEALGSGAAAPDRKTRARKFFEWN